MLPKSLIGKAIAYALKNWKELCRYVGDPRIRIDNNRSHAAGGITQRLFPGVAPKRDSGKEPVERSRAAADRSMEIDPPGRAPAKLAEMTFCEAEEAHRSDPTRRKLGHQVIPASDGGESPRRRAMGSC